MKTITISGVIGRWAFDEEQNVTPKQLKEALAEANGQDVLIEINSEGGSVYDGLEMFSAIRNYSGKTETRIVAFAASMGSILALAGDKISAENTAMFFVHNAWGLAIGDYREMEKQSKYLSDISSMMANLYAEKLNLTKAEAQSLMDDESQFFGSALGELGFDMVDAGAEVDEQFARAQATMRLERLKNNVDPDEFMSDIERAAASVSGIKKRAPELSEKPQATTKPKTENQDTTPADGANHNTEDTVENIADLKAQHPDLYAQAVQAGVEQERKRVSAHITMGTKSGATEKMFGFIKDGSSIQDESVLAEYMSANMNRQDIQNRQEDEPGDLGTDGEAQIDEADTKAYADNLREMRGVAVKGGK